MHKIYTFMPIQDGQVAETAQSVGDTYIQHSTGVQMGKGLRLSLQISLSAIRA